jgi:hypothetical protein
MRKMIESSQRMIGEKHNPIVNKHLELEIKALQDAPGRDEDKLEALLIVKEREKKQATEEDIADRHTKTVLIRVKVTTISRLRGCLQTIHTKRLLMPCFLCTFL